jgi:leucyl aminopeptidase
MRYASGMRALALVVSLFASSAPAVADSALAAHGDAGETAITIGADALPTARAVLGEGSLAFALNADVAFMMVDDDDLERLSEAMHELHGRCGGFMVHDSLEEAIDAVAPPPASAPIDYTIDRGDVVGAVLPAIREGDILATIRALSSRKNRYYRSESGAAASIWLRDRWRSFSDRSDVTVELFDQGYPQKSVIMTIRGTTKPDEIVVIGGHLDSIALGGTASNAPGADDDASGIATLDHIAKTLLDAGFRPERTLQFMAYAAEEVGLRGSQAIVRDYKRRGVNVVGVLQLDMTNYQGSDRDIWLIDDFTSPAQNRFLADLIERYTDATWGVDRCGYACSDHASWHRAGVPASMPHETRSRDRNQHIHTARDTLEVSNNNAAHAAKFARLGAAYAIELAKGTLAPDAARSASADEITGEISDVPLQLVLLLLVLALLGLRRTDRVASSPREP